jgi:hypothetical protein
VVWAAVPAQPAVLVRLGRQCRPSGSAAGVWPAMPVNMGNAQIYRRLSHCFSKFHNTMYYIIYLNGKT